MTAARPMHQQYHIRTVNGEDLIWDVLRLVELSKDFPVIEVPVADISELDELFWFHDGATPTPRKIAEHARQISDADLSYPIVLCSRGRVMDGMHRVCRALLDGRATIKAVRFASDPAPDYKNVDLKDLPY